MPPKYKLMYFPVKGLGEYVRYLLAYLGEDFEDYRFKPEEWASIKPTTPWGKAPVLEVNGKQVCQSIAIARYLGREAGLSGKNSWEDLRIDEIVDVINDLRSELAKYHYEADTTRKEALKEPIVNQSAPFYLKKLDEHIKQNNGYLANGKLSWADMYFTGISDYLSHMYGSDVTEDYSNLKTLKETVNSLPKIKAWIGKRPETAF